MLVAVATMLVDPRGRVLMHLRDDKPEILFPNHWSIFTGRLEEQDKSHQGGIRTSAQYGALRELSEELGVREGTNILPYVPESGIHLFYRGEYADTSQQRQQFIFEGRLDVPLDRLVLREGQELGLFSVDEIPKRKIAANYKEIVLGRLASYQEERGVEGISLRLDRE